MKSLILLIFSLMAQEAASQVVTEQIMHFFEEMETVGQVSSFDCIEDAPAREVPPNEEIDQRFRSIQLDVDARKSVEYEGEEISVVSLEEAKKMYDQFKELDYMPVKYLEDGCYARAHEFALIAEENGLKMGKAFLLPKNNRELLYPKSLKGKDPPAFHRSFSGWRYHSNAFIMVDTQDGIKPMVFDVGVADGPQTFEQWRENLSTSTEKSNLKVRERGHVFHDSNYKSSGTSVIESLHETEELINEIGYGEYLFRLESGWL